MGLARTLSRNAPLMRTLNRLCWCNAAAWNPEPDVHRMGTSSSLTTARQSPPAKPHAGHLASQPNANKQLARHHRLDRSA